MRVPTLCVCVYVLHINLLSSYSSAIFFLTRLASHVVFAPAANDDH